MSVLRANLSSKAGSSCISARLSGGSTQRLEANIQGGIEGPQGSQGVTYTPHVSDGGILSWTNDGELENPAPKNLTGPKGDVGPQGATGPQGPAGRDAEADTILQMDIDTLF